MRIESDCVKMELIEEEGVEEGFGGLINGSDDLRSVQEEKFFCEFAESSENAASVSRRKVSKPVNKGFNLRKSLAWNPAFFTEEGVLEPSELSYITGSNGFQKMSERSVLNEVSVDSCDKKSNQNSQLRFQNGRKLFCTPESSKKGARKINSRLPRPPIPNSQKRVPNTNSTIPKVPKFTSGNGNITPNSKNSNISKNSPAIKKEQSIIKKTSLLPPKPSNKIIPKTVSKPLVQQPSALTVNKNDSNNNCDKEVGPNSRILMKPSALKMPSPSFGFFSKGKVSPQASTNSQTKTDNKTLNTTIKPPNPNNTKPQKIPFVSSARCQTPIGRIFNTKLNNTPSTSTISKVQIEHKSVMQIGKFDMGRNSSGKKEKGERSIRVLKSKGEMGSIGKSKIRVCEETKEEMSFDDEIRVSEEGKVEMCCEGKIRVCEEETCLDDKTRVCEESNQKEDPNKEEKFTNQIPCDLESTLIEKQKSKRKSSVYGFSPLKNNKRDKTVFSPQKTNEIDGIGKLKETCSNGKIRVCEEKKEEIISNGEIRVCEEKKEEMSSNGEIKVCGELKEGSTSEIRVCEDPIDDIIDDKFTNQIPCDLENSLIEKQKSKRKSSIYGLSPLRKNKRDKTVFSPHKTKHIETEKSKSETEKSKNESLKADDTMSIDEKKRADCLTKCRKDLVPFSDEWFAALETFGEEILEKKTGAVQNSPPDKTVPEPSPWSPVKRKVQEIGPYDCTKYSKTVPSDPEK